MSSPKAPSDGASRAALISGTNDVRAWLRAIANWGDEYATVFIQNGFDTMSSVVTLTEADLEQMQILKPGHRWSFRFDLFYALYNSTPLSGA